MLVFRKVEHHYVIPFYCAARFLGCFHRGIVIHLARVALLEITVTSRVLKLDQVIGMIQRDGHWLIEDCRGCNCLCSDAH